MAPSYRAAESHFKLKKQVPIENTQFLRGLVSRKMALQKNEKIATPGGLNWELVSVGARCVCAPEKSGR